MISARRLTAELHVEVLGLDLLHRRADPDPGVVDQHVEAAVGLAVLGEDADHVLLLGHVGGDALDLEAVGAQALGGRLELLGAARRDRQRVALLAEHPGDRQPDPARGPRDQCRSLRHLRSPPVSTPPRTLSAIPGRRRGTPVGRAVSITCRRCALPLASPSSSPACSRSPRSRPAAAAAPTRPTRPRAATRRRKPPGAAEERLPQRRRADPARGAESGRRPAELVVSPAALVFYKGENRYPFGVFERDRTQVADAEVALYFAKVPAAEAGRQVEARQQRPGGESRRNRRSKSRRSGPFPAAIETLATAARLPRPDDQRRPRRRHASSTRPRSTSPATASGGSRP